jgi:hypothetical protein
VTAVAAPSALAVLFLASAVPAHAATEVFRDRMSGLVVEASSFSMSDDECIFTSVNVWADRETVQYSNFSYDECNDVELVTEFGSGTPTVFEVAKTLESAHLVAEVTLIDPMTGEATDEVVSLDLTWTATGPATRIRESYSESLPGEYRFTFRTIGTFAPATVEGLGENVEFARIGRASSMFMSVVHDPSAL